MRRYRVIATPHGDQITYRAEIHAWLTTTNTWHWEPVSTWTCPGTTTADAHRHINARGWTIAPDHTPTALPATVPVEPGDHDRILTDLAAHLQELARYQNARDNLLADLPPVKAPGHIPTGRLANVLGLPRTQLYVITQRLLESLQAGIRRGDDAQRREIMDQLSATEQHKLTP